MRFFLIFLFGLLALGLLPAQDSSRVSPLFASDELLEVRIETNLKALLKDVGAEREYHPARFSYVGEGGDSVHFQLKIKSRGYFRRNPRNCNCPPLRLNFKAGTMKGTLFEGQNKIKMVTHCQNKKPNYEQNLIQEYFIYKAFNLFTEESFKVRLLHVTYTDSFGKMQPMEKYAFLIENEDMMAARNGAKVNKKQVMHPDQGDRYKTNMVCLFQFMIGNTDFSIGQQHNIRLMSGSPLELNTPVPYDFDWSGLINAPYAKPNPMLQLGSVRERLFRGYCRSEEEFEKSFEAFRAQKETILTMYKDLPLLDEKTRNRGLEYLNEFFEIIDNPKKVKREFIRRCRT
jgi:hypothetical protein